MRSERDALERLYAAAQGTHWRVKTRWLEGNPCRWHGVECVRGGVTSIDLGGNGVRGTLPAELGNLSALRVLNIDESRISGTLPVSLAALSHLETVLLAGNEQLSGTLPALGQWPSLLEVDVSRSQLSGTVGTSVAWLPNLRRLQLDHGRLSGTLPTQIGALTRAEALFMHESRALSGVLPSQIGALTALLHGMSFASTRLSGSLPSQLGRLSRLRSLWLVHTAMSGALPPSLGHMDGLVQLEVHGARFWGSLPTELGRLSRLRACVLTAAQGPHQPTHAMRPVDRAAADSNRFACPLPTLPAPCVPHLRCWEPLQHSAAQRTSERAAHGEPLLVEGSSLPPAGAAATPAEWRAQAQRRQQQPWQLQQHGQQLEWRRGGGDGRGRGGGGGESGGGGRGRKRRGG